MARQHHSNSSKGRRRRYSNDGDSREEANVSSSSSSTMNTASMSSSLKKSEEDCKASRANNNTITTTKQQSSNNITTTTSSPEVVAEVIPAKLSQESYFGLNQDEFIHAFSSVIQEISSQGDMIPIEAQQKTHFHTANPPRISLAKYMDRIIKFAFCSAECYILSLVYMDRLVQSNPNFVISSFSIHRLLITSIMVAAKFFDDKFYNNEYYAKIGGIQKEEINKLEIEFLYMINFSLHFQPPEFEQYKEEFIVSPALKRRLALSKHSSHPCVADECSREEFEVTSDMARLSLETSSSTAGSKPCKVAATTPATGKSDSSNFPTRHSNMMTTSNVFGY